MRVLAGTLWRMSTSGMKLTLLAFVSVSSVCSASVVNLMMKHTSMLFSWGVMRKGLRFRQALNGLNVIPCLSPRVFMSMRSGALCAELWWQETHLTNCCLLATSLVWPADECANPTAYCHCLCTRCSSIPSSPLLLSVLPFSLSHTHTLTHRSVCVSVRAAPPASRLSSENAT